MLLVNSGDSNSTDHSNAGPGVRHLPVVHDDGAQVAGDESVHPAAGSGQEHARLQ